MKSGESEEKYLRRMMPMVRWVASRRATRHPYLGAEDLFQEGLIALMSVWRRHYPKTPKDLTRLGWAAVLKTMWAVRRRAWSRGERDGPTHVDLESPVTGSEDDDPLQLQDVVGADGVESVFFLFALDELERGLSDAGRLVLGELLDPGRRTLAAVRSAWSRKRSVGGGNWWLRHRASVLADGTGLDAVTTCVALTEVRKKVRELFLIGEPPVGEYSIVRGLKATQHVAERRSTMSSEKGFIPDESGVGIELPEPLAKVAMKKESAVKKEPEAAKSEKSAGTVVAGKKPAVKKSAPVAKDPVKAKRAETPVSVKAAVEVEKVKVKAKSKKESPAAVDSGKKSNGKLNAGLKERDAVLVVAKPAKAGTFREQIQKFCGKSGKPFSAISRELTRLKAKVVDGKIWSMIRDGHLRPSA